MPETTPARAYGSQVDFQTLEDLRAFLREISDHQIASLTQYHDVDSGGFFHRLDEQSPGDFSKASTATCVLSLDAAGRWEKGPWGSASESLAEALLMSDWKSAGLKVDNVFTTSFVLEAASVLEARLVSVPKAPGYTDRLSKAEKILETALSAGGAQVSDYPPSAYITQLAVRVLLRRARLGTDTSASVCDWAWKEVDHQLALFTADSKIADVFQLAYALIVATALSPPGKSTPDQSLIQQAALREFFSRQLPDGSWPRSRPLFHYPGVGSAHCFEYELLVQLLSQPTLRDRLLEYLPNLERAAYALRSASYPLGEDAFGWSSGHHPQVKGPESWSTASVFHYVHVLDRLVAEAIRRSIFNRFRTPYRPPGRPKSTEREFGPDFLDCALPVGTDTKSLRTTLYERFVSPIAQEAQQIAQGGSLSENTPMSAILFGPPGTSKTELSRLIAEYLGWPRLIIDPSFFVREGMHQIEAEANRLFSMLAVAEQIVVLLDEFDEMVRDRQATEDPLSRFLTTGMLPKLTSINKSRRIVFLVATNYIDSFDLAISRHGRFDMILQVLPPPAKEKLGKWPSVQKRLEELKLQGDGDLLKALSQLTFGEFRIQVQSLESAETADEFKAIVDQACSRCTMNTRPASEPEEDVGNRTWEEICKSQEPRVRID